MQNHCNYSEKYRHALEPLYAKHQKRATIGKFCGTVCSLLFVIFSFVLTFATILFIDRGYPLEEQMFANWEAFSRFFDPVIKLLLLGEAPWYRIALRYFSILFLLPFAVNGLLTLFGGILVKKKGLPEFSDKQAIPLLYDLLSCAFRASSSLSTPMQGILWSASGLFALVAMVLLTFGVFSEGVSVSEGIFGVIIVLVLGALIFGAYLLLAWVFAFLNSLLWWGKVKGASKLLREIRKDLDIEERPIKEAEARKKAREKAAERIPYCAGLNLNLSGTPSGGLTNNDHDELDELQKDLVRAGILPAPDYSDM